LRLRRPRTLLSLTLVGIGLVTLPLLIGVGNAFFKLNELMQQSGLAVDTSRESTRANERASQALTDMRRHGGAYIAFAADPPRRPDALDRYRTAARDMEQTLEALATLEPSVTVRDQLAQLESMLAVVNSTVTAPGTTRTLFDEDIAEMATAASNVEAIMRDNIEARMSELAEDTQAARSALAWQAGALIPGTLILVVFFVLLVVRPMRQLDRAIRELGRGDFSREIAVSGPTDIETLGEKLEWLRLRLAESTEEKNRFLRHMSHELKTPLANIREGTELLLDGSVGGLDRQQLEVTGILRENGIKLQQLIENLLTFSAWQAKTASLEISEFELKPVVFQTLSQHRLVISNREIKLDLDVPQQRVEADEGKIRLVLENLISNAIKFTPERGKIAVRARAEGPNLRLEVADSGPGIAADERGMIFEAFFQGRQLQGGPVGGTGIGLSVVRECVQAHGGTIELRDENESALGGAHFVVRLPLRKAREKPRLVVSNG